MIDRSQYQLILECIRKDEIAPIVDECGDVNITRTLLEILSLQYETIQWIAKLNEALTKNNT